jgi:hypothetical protein
MYCVVKGCRKPSYSSRASAHERAQEILQQHPNAWWVSRARLCKRCSVVIGASVFHLCGEDEFASVSDDASQATSVCDTPLTLEPPAVSVTQDATCKDAATLLTERLLATWERMKSEESQVTT